MIILAVVINEHHATKEKVLIYAEPEYKRLT